MNDVVIVGVGEADGGKSTGRTAYELATEAALRAISDAGLEKRQVDGILLESPMSEHHHMPATLFLEYIGVQPRLHAAYSIGGATPHALAIHGAALIKAGLCETVLVVDADSRSSRFGGDKVAAMARAASDIEPIDLPYHPTVPARYALVAQRHMFEFGTTREQLAAVAVATREHAQRNPQALYREPLSVDQVLRSPEIASPLHLLDCCMVSDWGTAFVLTSAQRAAANGRPAVPILGYGESAMGYNIAAAPSLTDSPIQTAAKTAFAMAGVTPDQVQIAQIYDSFTITALLAIEDLGFCAKGEAGAFVEAGHTRPGGRLPVNTHGGQLSYQCGHGQYIVEAVRQLRGQAGPRQVPGARLAVSHATAAVCSAAFTLVLGQ